MIRKTEVLAATVLFAVHCGVAVGQSPTATVLTVDLENFVLYQTDASDISKYATNPGPTPSVVPKNLYVETLLADIVAVNGQPAKGLYAARGQTIVTSPTPAPGSAVVRQPFPASPLQVVNSPAEVLVNGKKTDPLSSSIQQRLGVMLISAGQYDEAAGHCAECLGRALLGQGRTSEAIQILSTIQNPRYLGYAYGRVGRREEAAKLAAAVAPNAFSQALIYAGLGDKDRTLEALDRVVELGPARIGRALNSPEFALLRGDPRVSALRKKVGLPE
jgi:hypothetical protein